MFMLILFSGLVYLVIGVAFAMLSLHELATGRRNRALNRLIAWSGIVLWLPMLLVVLVSALFASMLRTRPSSVRTRARSGAVLAEQRVVRRAVRQA